VHDIHPINNGDLRINGGFFIFKKQIFDYIREKEELVIEPFHRLLKEKQLIGYTYDGFWRAWIRSRTVNIWKVWPAAVSLHGRYGKTTVAYSLANSYVDSKFATERSVPVQSPLPRVHSDDIEIGCGGTILQWLSSHKDLEIVWVVFSSGGSEREKEARASAELFLEQAKRKSND